MTKHTWLEMGEAVIEGLEAIQHLTKLGGDQAAAGLKAIEAILKALDDGFAGSSTPDEVLARIDALHVSLKANDDTVDAELAQKFDTGGEG